MALKDKIHQALHLTQEGTDFLSYVASGKNKMKCYENAPKLQKLLKDQGMQTILVGAHYPDIHSTCTNFYLLCRQDNEVLLVDPTVNTEINTDSLFLATHEEAMETIRAHSSINWRTNWNFDQIIIHEPKADLVENREQFKSQWGEFSKGLIFKDQIKRAPSSHTVINHTMRLGNPVSKDELARRYPNRTTNILYSGRE
jgi:hypothetical protein